MSKYCNPYSRRPNPSERVGPISLNKNDNNALCLNKRRSALCFGLINIHSIRNKVIPLCELLLHNKIELCCLTETWLTEADTAIHAALKLYGFKLEHKPRENKAGGSVGIISRINMKIVDVKSSSYNYFELFQSRIHTNATHIRISVI